jgi:hypothetical protein
MESTGIYWKPVYNVLEDDAFEIILVNARHVKNIPGHKTDKKDSAWLSKLLLSGLLKGSFIPPVDIRELRDLVRYKKKKTQVVAAEKNRMIKMNPKEPKEIGMPTIGAKAKNKSPCNMARVTAPKILPRTKLLRGIGATSTAWRKPSFLSSMMEIVEKIAVKRKMSVNVPGKK